jgi:hypothetical protein
MMILHGSEWPSDGLIFEQATGLLVGPKGRPAKCLKDAFSATPVLRDYS